jgi:protein tyrosine/serine phosphatase
MMALSDHLLRDSYWVLPKRLLAGEYPGSKDEKETRQRLGWLLDQGITFFVDLTEDCEGGKEPYEFLLMEEASARGVTAIHHHKPIRDFGIPTEEEMTQTLDALDVALAAGHRVYVHCAGGIGRTGMVIGCYLVRHGIGVTGQHALDHLARLRKDTANHWQASRNASAAQNGVVLDAA